MSVLIDRERSIELMRRIHILNCRKSLEEMGKFILLLIDKILRKKKWIRIYGDLRQEMADYAVIECVKGIWRWNPYRGATPYTFFQMIAERSFCHALERHRDFPIPASRLKGSAKDLLNRRLGLGLGE
jgi:hypothetical protein